MTRVDAEVMTTRLDTEGHLREVRLAHCSTGEVLEYPTAWVVDILPDNKHAHRCVHAFTCMRVVVCLQSRTFKGGEEG